MSKKHYHKEQAPIHAERRALEDEETKREMRELLQAMYANGKVQPPAQSQGSSRIDGKRAKFGY